jgi:16S rRNA (adenine1518-N6/adenine1519-N6)-dimethyltransferase
MRELLAGRGIQLTKSLGQNFLHDGNQLRRIVAAAELTREDKVLEVGPGLGPLTERLVEQAGEVLAIEKDERLAAVLTDQFGLERGATPGLRLVRDDALDYLRREARDWSEWKLVANLPYSVASPILVELAQSPLPPRRMVATLQLEVARRLMAEPGGGDYGVLTLLVQLDFEPQGWFKIPASCFFPEPDVDSACLCLVRRPGPRIGAENRRTFVRVVKRAFSQRRKMMMKLLREDWLAEALARAFAELGLPATIRAEAVSRGQFVQLSERLAASAPHG